MPRDRYGREPSDARVRDAARRYFNERRQHGGDTGASDDTDAERRRRAQMEGLRRVMADTRKARTARVEPPPPHDGHAKDPRTAAVSPTPVEEDEEERRRRG